MLAISISPFKKEYNCYIPHSSIVAPKVDFTEQDKTTASTDDSLRTLLTAHDLKRLESYTNNRVDYHMVRYFEDFSYL